jgi:hypothetical protein
MYDSTAMLRNFRSSRGGRFDSTELLVIPHMGLGISDIAAEPVMSLTASVIKVLLVNFIGLKSTRPFIALLFRDSFDALALRHAL